MNTFSVIIPTHNIPELLQRCLDSIPDIEDIQVIVIDDNSNPEMVDFDCFPGLNRKYTTFIFDKQGGGAGHARNLGLKELKSKWVLFSDSDDFLNEGWYDELCKYKDSDADSIFFKAKSVDTITLKETDRNITLNNSIDRYFQNELNEYDIAMCNGAPWAKLVKVNLIKENNITFDEVRYANDVMFSTKVACCSRKIQVSDYPLYTITTREGSLAYASKTDPDNLLSRLDVFIRVNKYLRQMGFSQKSLFEHVLAARKINNETAKIAIDKLWKNDMLFKSFWIYIKSILNHICSNIRVLL